MNGESNGAEANLEDYRDYLHVLAQTQLDQQLQGKIDLSGVVQQTMLEAHQASPRIQVQNAGHLAAWLRRILANNLADEIRKLRTGKRDLNRERSLEASLEQSSNQLQAWLADRQCSPSGSALRQEQTLHLTAALAKLPDAQREALILRHLRGMSLAQIADHFDRSHAAVAGLIKRGLQKLRSQLRDWE